MLMNYANSLQLAYNIGDNQKLAYAAPKTIRSRRSPTPTPVLMWRSRLASVRADPITGRINVLITAASAPGGPAGGVDQSTASGRKQDFTSTVSEPPANQEL